MLTGAQRFRRAAATVLVSGALLLGTFWGTDYHFPFGPFRMYSIANRLDGRIRSALVEVRVEGRSEWAQARTPGDLGMKRAEIEGQLSRFVADPGLLRHLATAYERLAPEEGAVVEVRLRQETTRLRAGRPAGVVAVETLATWSRP
jgi:hypothetical protein